MLETPFDLFTTQLCFCYVQQDRVYDFVTCNLSGEKRDGYHFVVTEFHLSAVCKCSNPLVVWHFRYPTNIKCRRRLQILGEGGGASTVRSDQPRTRQRQGYFRQYKLPVPVNSIFGSAAALHKEDVYADPGLALVFRGILER